MPLASTFEDGAHSKLNGRLFTVKQTADQPPRTQYKILDKIKAKHKTELECDERREATVRPSPFDVL